MTTTRVKVNDVTLYVIIYVIMTLAEMMRPACAINWL